MYVVRRFESGRSYFVPYRVMAVRMWAISPIILVDGLNSNNNSGWNYGSGLSVASSSLSRHRQLVQASTVRLPSVIIKTRDRAILVVGL